MIKTGVIAATILACIFGVIGFPTSLKQAEANAGQRIHLGLDLSGGTYLILQVHVQDAAKSEADALIEGLQRRSANAQYSGGGLRPKRSGDPEGYRFHPDQYSRRGCRKDAGIPLHGGR